MKKEGIQTRKRKPKSSHNPSKEGKLTKASSSLQQGMQTLSAHQYISGYEPSDRNVESKPMLNYETGTTKQT